MLVDPVALFNGIDRIAENNTVADNLAACGNIAQRDLMSLRNILIDGQTFHNLCTRFPVRTSDNHVVLLFDFYSIPRAAEKLVITLSALNLQLLRLEKELGVPLFFRSKTDMQPTPAGEVYLKYAREILCLKKQAYNMIGDMANTHRGHLSIGFTPGRGIEMFTQVYPTFHCSFPQVVVEPWELSVHKQQQMIARGDLDIGFQTLSKKQRTGDASTARCEEEIVLAIPTIHPVSRFAAPKGEPFAVLDPSLLQHEPFVLMYKESTIRATVDEIFRASGFVPNVLFETSNNNTIISMIQARLCCGVVPYYYVKDDPDGITCFSFPSRPTWDVVASYRKDAYLNNSAKYFIELAGNYWNGA